MQVGAVWPAAFANNIAAMNVEPLEIMAYLAPAIGPDAFEVGQDVFDAFCTPMPELSLRLKTSAAANTLPTFTLWRIWFCTAKA